MQNDKDRLLALAQFIRAFRTSGFRFAEWRKSTRDASGFLTLPYCELSEDAKRFVQAAHEFGWVMAFDWPSWADTEPAKRLMRSAEEIARASIDDLARVVTVVIRGERFNDGTLLAAFDAGLLTAIVERAGAILAIQFAQESP